MIRDNLNNDKFLKILTDKAKYIASTENIGQFFLRIKKWIEEWLIFIQTSMIINQVLWVPTRTDEHRIATCQTQLTIHPCLSSPFLPDLIRYHLQCWEEWEDPCSTWADDRRTLKTGAKQKHYSRGIWIISTFSSEPLLLIHYEYRFFYFKFFFTYFSWFQSPRKTLKECWIHYWHQRYLSKLFFLRWEQALL